MRLFIRYYQKNFFGINEAQCYKKCRALPGKKKKFLNSVSSTSVTQAISVIFLIQHLTCHLWVEFPTCNHFEKLLGRNQKYKHLCQMTFRFCLHLIVGCLSLFLDLFPFLLFPSSSTYKCIPAVIPFHLHFLLRDFNTKFLHAPHPIFHFFPQDTASSEMYKILSSSRCPEFKICWRLPVENFSKKNKNWGFSSPVFRQPYRSPPISCFIQFLLA